MTKSETQRSRRKFLNIGAIAIALAAAGTEAYRLLASGKSHDSGDKVKVLTTDGSLVEVDKAAVEKVIPEIPMSAHPVREGIPGRKWVMVFDLSKCKGAGKCLSACSKMHYLPPNRSYIRLSKMRDDDLSSPYWMPSPCFHCDSPPCVKACPVGATFKLSDGIVGIDNERCIGCRFCMVACPYSARIFNWSEDDYRLTPGQLSQITPHDVCSTHKLGTVEKCDFCPHNLVKGLLPDCVTQCPYEAIYFGDENEDAVSNGRESVSLSKLLKEKGGHTFRKELGTRPRVYYLPAVDRQFPFEDRNLDFDDYI